MKIVRFLVALSFFAAPNASAQRVVVSPDSTIQITHDSTGYVDIHPHDIPDETGLFIYSADGQEALRIFGSFRLLSVWEDKKNFHAFDLTQPTIPTGVDDFRYPNSVWTANMSRLGFDALIGNEQWGDLLVRTELDWKGDDEKFRIRHLFLRSRHWLFGQSWTSVANISYLIQAIDGRFTGGAVGIRPPMVRYYNQTEKLKYQFSLEYSAPTLIQPDSLGAEAAVLVPNLAGKVSYETGPFDIMVAGAVRRNRVQFTSDDFGSQTATGYTAVVAAKLQLGETNRLMMSVNGGSGMANYLGDFAFVDADLAYNPGTQSFENMGAYSGFVGFEHDWSAEWTSALGGGIAGLKEKSFSPSGFFENGGKVLTNLFYRPAAGMNNFVVGGEVEYAERRNLDTASNNTTRASVLLIYSF